MRSKYTIPAAAILAAGLMTGCSGTTTKTVADDAKMAVAAVTTTHAASPYDKPGYVTQVEDGRLWVFEADSPAYAKFKEHGEPAKLVTRIGAGPNRMTIKSVDASVIDGYLLSRPGYVTKVEDGRLWVFEADSEAYAKFKEHGEPAKMVTRIGAGPNRMTIKSVDASVIDGYLQTMTD